LCLARPQESGGSERLEVGRIGVRLDIVTCGTSADANAGEPLGICSED
jgi:hypothetical protein